MILNVFKTGINGVSLLTVFKLLLFFLTARWLLQHTSLAQVFDYDSYRRTQACFVYCATTHGPTLLVVNSGSFAGPCRCSYIFVLCLAFHAYVAGDLNKTISFLVGVLSTSFTRALLELIH